MIDYEEEKRLLNNWRGRRLLACRAVDTLVHVIENIGKEDGSQLPPDTGLPSPPNPALRREFRNVAATLLRLILLSNDGHVSPMTLNTF